MFISLLIGNLKFVVFSVPKNAEQLGSFEDPCLLLDYVVFWEGCVKEFWIHVVAIVLQTEISYKESYILPTCR